MKGGRAQGGAQGARRGDVGQQAKSWLRRRLRCTARGHRVVREYLGWMWREGGRRRVGREIFARQRRANFYRFSDFSGLVHLLPFYAKTG